MPMSQIQREVRNVLQQTRPRTSPTTPHGNGEELPGKSNCSNLQTQKIQSHNQCTRFQSKPSRCTTRRNPKKPIQRRPRFLQTRAGGHDERNQHGIHAMVANNQ